MDRPATTARARGRRRSEKPLEESTYTPRPHRRPWHGRLFESVGQQLMRWGVPVGQLTEESLCRAAQRKTGLRDFGEDGFRIPLGILLRDFEEDEHFGFMGRLAVRQTIVEGLVNRLRIQEALERQAPPRARARPTAPSPAVSTLCPLSPRAFLR